jgi:Antitoxin Xre/MbcA/ParS C-terminal toxin-binding domain/Antitoxin Xre-like helix-turn-helix domain
MRPNPSAKPGRDATPDESGLLTKATLRAADRMKIKNVVLAKILGVSEPTISRMRNGRYQLARGQKPFELAVLLIRLYRSLDGIVGGDDGVSADWLTNNNTALDGIPLQLMQSVSGLMNVIHYLDARRAVV